MWLGFQATMSWKPRLMIQFVWILDLQVIALQTNHFLTPPTCRVRRSYFPIPPAWSNTIGVKVRTRHVLYFGWYYNRRWHEDTKEESRNPEIYWDHFRKVLQVLSGHCISHPCWPPELSSPICCASSRASRASLAARNLREPEHSRSFCMALVSVQVLNPSNAKIQQRVRPSPPAAVKSWTLLVHLGSRRTAINRHV